MKVDRIPVRENEVNSYGIGAEGASERVVQNVEKTYKPGTAAGSLLMWYKQELSDPAMWVSSNRKGVITLPDLSCAYSPRPEVAVTKAGVVRVLPILYPCTLACTPLRLLSLFAHTVPVHPRV